MCAAFLSVIGFGVAPSAANLINLIQNGSFEDSNLPILKPNGEFGTLVWRAAHGITPNLPHWRVTDLVDGKMAWYAHKNSADVKNTGPGTTQHGDYCYNIMQTDTLDQSFPVKAGWRYDVSFWEAARHIGYGYNPPPWESLYMKLTASSGTLTDLGIGTLPLTGSGTNVLTGIANAPKHNWFNWTCSFIPSADTTVNIMFGCHTKWEEGAYLDNVWITEIPEPSTLALLAGGLVGLLCYAWKKRR